MGPGKPMKNPYRKFVVPNSIGDKDLGMYNQQLPQIRMPSGNRNVAAEYDYKNQN